MGVFQGFIYQVISLLSLIAIAVFALPAAEFLKLQTGIRWLEASPVFILWIGMAILIMLTALLTRLLLTRVTKTTGLGAIDRWLGMALGSLKGLVIAVFIAIAFHMLPPSFLQSYPDMDQDLENSKAIQATNNIFEWRFLDSTEALRELKARFYGDSYLQYEKGTPWDYDSGVDSR